MDALPGGAVGVTGVSPAYGPAPRSFDRGVRRVGMVRVFGWACLVALTGCATIPWGKSYDTGPGIAAMRAGPPSGFRPRPVVVGSLASDVVMPPAASDSLVTTVRWTNPVDDGKGPLDSMTVKVTRLTGNWLPVLKYTGAFPTTATFRQPIPPGDATHTLVAEVCTFRGTGNNAVQCVSASSEFVYAAPAPPGVTGVQVTNTKTP